MKLKRSIAFLLTLAIIVTMIPNQIFAEGESNWSESGVYNQTWLTNQTTAGNDGSESTPYIINGAADLAALAVAVNAGNKFEGKFIEIDKGLTGIDLSNYEWTPIGTSSNPFKGTFDGNDRLIKGLHIGTEVTPNDSLACVGLFGYILDGLVKNVGVDVSIYSSIPSANVGGIAGYLGNVKGSLYTSNSMGAIFNSYATGTVIGGTTANVGGLVGYNSRGTILNSCATNDVTGGAAAYVGGLVGYDNISTISCVYSTGTATGGAISIVGGLVGNFSAGGSSIKGAFWNTEAAPQAIGSGIEVGITGKISNEMLQADFVTTLNGSADTGVARFNKWMKDSLNQNKGFPVPSAFCTISFDLNGGSGSSPSDMLVKVDSEFTLNPSLATIIPPPGKVFCLWNKRADGMGSLYQQGNTYDEYMDLELYAIYRDPRWQDEGNYDTTLYGKLTNTTDLKSIFDNGGVLEIDNAAELAAFGKATTSTVLLEYIENAVAEYNAANSDALPPKGAFLNVKLMNNIDLSGFDWTPMGASSIGSSNFMYLNFDGNNKTISNLAIKGINDQDMAIGLFGLLIASEVKNLYLNGNMAGIAQAAGGIAAVLYNSDIENCVSDVDMNISGVTEMVVAGGIAGMEKSLLNDTDTNDPNLLYSNITNSVNRGNIQLVGASGYEDNYFAFGICGASSSDAYLKINNCYNTGTLPVSAYPIGSTGTTGENNYYLDTCMTVVHANSPGTSMNEADMKAPAFVDTLNTWVNVQNEATPSKYLLWASKINAYPAFEWQRSVLSTNATVTVDSIAEQPIPATDTKIIVPIKAVFDKNVTLQKIEYSISYNNTAFAVDEADYSGLTPSITTVGTTSTLKITKTFADTTITAGIGENIDFKPIVKSTVMAGEQLINVVPKITIVQEGDIFELGTAQNPITSINGTVNLVKPPYSSGASMVVTNMVDALNIVKTEIPAPTTNYSGKIVLVNGQIKLSVPFATFSSLPTSTGSLFGKVTFDENVLTFDSFDGSSSGFTATKTGTNEIRIDGDCDDSANLNTNLANVVLNFTLKKIPDNYQTEISSSDFSLTEKDGDGNIDISRKDNLAATPKIQTIKFVQKGDPTGEITDNYIKLVLNAATSVGDVDYKTYTYPSLSLTSNKDITGARVYITEGFDLNDKIGYNDIFTNQVVNGITIKVTNGGRIITLTGTASPAVYQDVLSKVSIKLKNTNVERNVVFEAYNPNSTVVLNGTKTNIIPFYNPDNGHLYEYVQNSNVKWTSAVSLAPQRSIGGMTGYLATITDETESGIVAGLCAGQGWLGGSQDMNTLNTLLGKNFTGQGLKYTKDYLNPNMAQGKWFWVTGPEAGQQFYKQTASEASGNLRIPGDNLGMYNNWLPTYEPNNYYNYGENYLHIYPNSGKWNDYMNNQSGIGGYVVEYGGMKDDAPIAISMARVTTNLLNPSDGSSKLEVLFPALPSKVSSGYTVPLYGANSTAYTWEQIAGTSSLTDGYKLMNSSETNRTITIRATGTMPNALAKTKDYVITVLATKANILSVAAPSLSAEGKNAKVALAWAAVDNANYYEVYYKTTNAGSYNVEPIIANGPTTEVLGLTNGTEYTFKIVAAFDSSLKSDASNEVDATPVAPATYLTNIIVRNSGTTYPISPNFNEGEPNYIVTIPSATTTVDITTTKVGDGTVNGEGNGINVNSPATVSIDSSTNDLEDKTYTITFIKQYPKLLINYTYQNPTIGNTDGQLNISATGGSGTGYKYSIDGGDSWATGFVFTDLAEGSYLLQIKDDAGNLSEMISATLVANGKILADIGYSPDDLYENGNPQSSGYEILPEDVLVLGTDYTVTYTDQEGRIIPEPSLAGTYNMAVTINEDQPNYYGTKMWQFRIIRLEAPSIVIGEVSSMQGYKINDTISYDPEVTYKNGGTNKTETVKWEYSTDGLNWTPVGDNTEGLTIDANCINKSIRFTVTAYEKVNGHDTPTTTVSTTIVLKPAAEGGVVNIPTITNVTMVHEDDSTIDDTHRARHNGIVQANVTTTEDTSSVIDGDSGYDYKWYRDGVLIDGATAQTYILNKEDVGKIISVKVAIRTDYDTGALIYTASNTATVYADLNMSPNISATSTDKKFSVGDKITVNLAVSKYYDNIIGSNLISLKYGVVSSDSENSAVSVDKDLLTSATSLNYTIKTADANKRYIIFKIQASEVTLGEPITVRTCILRIDTQTGIATSWAYKLDYIVTDNANFTSYKVYQIITNIGSNNTAKITVDTAKVAGDANAKMYYSSERGKYVVVMPANITPDKDKFIVEEGTTDTIFYGKQDNSIGELGAEDINKPIQVWLKKDLNADNTNLVITEVAGDGVIDPNDAAQIASAILANKKAGKLGILSK